MFCAFICSSALACGETCMHFTLHVQVMSHAFMNQLEVKLLLSVFYIHKWH